MCDHFFKQEMFKEPRQTVHQLEREIERDDFINPLREISSNITVCIYLFDHVVFCFFHSTIDGSQ